MSTSLRRRLPLAGALAALTLLASACSLTSPADDAPGAQQPGDGASKPSQSAAPESVAAISSNIARGARKVDLTQKVRIRVAEGTFEDLKVTGPGGTELQGRMSADKTRWVSQGRLQAATRYQVVSSAVDAQGLESTYESRFRTRALSLDEQTYPSFFPTGGTVGVGMPAVIRFDVPVTDKAEIQKHLQVVSQPAQAGAFHWISDQEVHWRPRTYWKPGTKVTVKADIKGVPAGNGIYGQLDRSASFQVGRSMISKVDMNTHQMRVFENGKLIRTIPITTGEQPKFTTRSGTKVIIEKFRHKRMNSETVGIDPDSADGYDIDDVQYAMRVTYSGEFIHAAPWSVDDQGRANVSHGCTGMSTSNAGWLYDRSIIGDVVEYTGTSRPTDLTNGLGDWNLSWADYRAGAA